MSGQKVRLKIIDFASEYFKFENKTADFPIYGYIQDGSQRVQFTGSLERERLLYESKSSEVSVEMLSEMNDLGFLIQFQSKDLNSVEIYRHNIVSTSNIKTTSKYTQKCIYRMCFPRKKYQDFIQIALIYLY